LQLSAGPDSFEKVDDTPLLIRRQRRDRLRQIERRPTTDANDHIAMADVMRAQSGDRRIDVGHFRLSVDRGNVETLHSGGAERVSQRFDRPIPLQSPRPGHQERARAKSRSESAQFSAPSPSEEDASGTGEGVNHEKIVAQYVSEVYVLSINHQP
jgi:hypothetical protein